ncbi:MAG: STAS domain-containing protein [bacterium]|nr:STAS domain-containing protein [bacterium]
MNITKTEKSDLLIIKLDGKFDIEQTQNFEKSFESMIGSRPPRVGMDMTGLNFIDSSGMGSLIKGLNKTRNYGGEMILYGLKPMILNVFKLAKLDNFFKVMTPDEFQKQYLDDD